LEAAVWGKPIFFGPNYQKFKEARELIQCNAAFSVTHGKELQEHINSLLKNETLLHTIGNAAKAYVLENTGATTKIIDYIKRTGV
jgi:3-deoxy-D-manno-octulosonic-acid transferase